MAKARRKHISEPAPISAAAGLYYGHENQADPAPLNLNVAIMRRLTDGEDPGHTVDWAGFCEVIRDDCDAQGKRGFSDRHIKRLVRSLRSSARRV
jgi:hypothetical protein